MGIEHPGITNVRATGHPDGRAPKIISGTVSLMVEVQAYVHIGTSHECETREHLIEAAEDAIRSAIEKTSIVSCDVFEMKEDTVRVDA